MGADSNKPGILRWEMALELLEAQGSSGCAQLLPGLFDVVAKMCLVDEKWELALQVLEKATSKCASSPMTTSEISISACAAGLQWVAALRQLEILELGSNKDNPAFSA